MSSDADVISLVARLARRAMAAEARTPAEERSGQRATPLGRVLQFKNPGGPGTGRGDHAGAPPPPSGGTAA
jgi:hypothetical protein